MKRFSCPISSVAADGLLNRPTIVLDNEIVVKDAEGTFIAYPAALRSSADPLVQQAVANLNKYAENEEIAQTYHAMDTFIRITLFAKVVEMMGDDLTWENFTAKAETLNNYKTGVFPPVTFKPGAHLGTRGGLIYAVKNGAFVQVTDWLQLK